MSKYRCTIKEEFKLKILIKNHCNMQQGPTYKLDNFCSQ
jgi:hypothetical protein